MGVDVDKAMADLKSRMDGLPGAENKLTMVVMSGDWDKQLAAMIIATGAAAMGMKVVLFFTFWATSALRAPRKKAPGKNLMGKMFGFMLPKGRDRLPLSRMNMAGIGPALFKSLMKKGGRAGMGELWEVAAQMAVKVYICEMSMSLMGMKQEEMIEYPDLEVCGVATMLAHARESAIQFFI